MNEMIIHGGHKLSGQITIGGAKNSTVALIPAAILSDTPIKFSMVPDILDVHNLMSILELLNVSSKFVHRTITINPTHIKDAKLTNKVVTSLRASYYFMGALLSRFGHATVGLPGGDNFGRRPIDQHLKAFESLGAEVHVHPHYVNLTTHGHGLHGGDINLAMVSVGATINSLLAAVKAKGKTTIHNAAKEPEIIDIINFLNEMGAKIKGAGTHTIHITGVSHLGTHKTHRIIPDRIEAGTYLSMAAAVGNGIKINNIIPKHLMAFIHKLQKAGVKLKLNKNSIYVPKSNHIKPIKIITHPFPRFATDLQQPITPLLLKADGTSIIKDTIYPHRNKHVKQLKKMGANIKVAKDGSIIINHTNKLLGAHVKADEIRAGASEVIAALMAHGTTVISNANTILRGYDNIISKLTSLGASIELSQA